MFKNNTHNLKSVSHFEIVFNGSALLETKGYFGISHIIEHCMCEKVKELEKEFKVNSITWNALTSSNSVKFYMNGMYSAIKKYKDIFTNKILNYTIEKEVFERERNIIIAEYYQTFSDQTTAFILNWIRRHYNFNEAIGLIDDIKNLTYEKFIEYKNKYYNKPSYIGYIHPKKKEDITKLNFDIKFNNIDSYPKYNDFGNYTNYNIEHYADFKAQRILANINSFKLSESCKEYVYMTYLIDILCGGLTSPLYKELRENLQGVYSISPDIAILDRNNFRLMLLVYADNDKYINTFDKFKNMMKNVEKYINKKEFNIAKKELYNAKKLKNLTSYTNDSCFSEISNKINDLILSNSITYKEFIEYIKTINFNNFYIDSDY